MSDALAEFAEISAHEEMVRKRRYNKVLRRAYQRGREAALQTNPYRQKKFAIAWNQGFLEAQYNQNNIGPSFG